MERQLDWMRLDSALKKVVPNSPKNLVTFWCTGWAWNCQIIFRCASVHGRAGFIWRYKFYLKSEYKNIQHKLWRAFKADILVDLNILCPLDITCDNFVSRRICAAKVISLFFIHDVCVFCGVLGWIYGPLK